MAVALLRVLLTLRPRGVKTKRVLKVNSTVKQLCWWSANNHAFTIIELVDRKSGNMMYISYRCKIEYISNHI